MSEKKTPDEWSALDGVTVMDPDGWRFPSRFGDPSREYGPQDWGVPITRQEWEDRLGLSSAMHPSRKTTAVQKWADPAMFASERLDATTGPRVHLLAAPADPLGQIAAMALMYQGIVVRDLADVTDEQRREMFAQIRQTKLKAPFEAVTFHWMVEGVTRSLTHQMVRQRTAVFAQESLRFAVVGVEDHFGERVALPPSLAQTRAVWQQHEHDILARLSGGAFDIDPMESEVQHELAERMSREPQEEQQRWAWDRALEFVEAKYAYLVGTGIPAEDARGLLPHNITTRLNYVTNLRNFQDHAGARLCTQAQFEWRAVWLAFVQELRRYGETQSYRVREGVTANPAVNAALGNSGHAEFLRSSAWQYELLAELFRPACYLTGKCEFAAQDLDRKCRIRHRVDANHEIGRRPEEWDQEYDNVDTTEIVVGAGPQSVIRNEREQPVFIGAIQPAEWLADPGAAR